MNIPEISGLRSEIWAGSTASDRLGSLQELENFLSSEDNRTPCQVDSRNLAAGYRGVHENYQDGSEIIALSSDLVQSDQPYQAVETLMHEDRHSHQHHIVNHPELAEDSEQLENMKMSNDGGYIQPDEINHSTYRFQPAEMDANKAARSQTDSLYQDTFKDEANYPDYKAQKEQEITDDVEYAKFELGENYVEEAKQAMASKYEFNQDIVNQRLNTDLEQGNENNSSSIKEEDIPTEETSLDESEDYNYGYGY